MRLSTPVVNRMSTPTPFELICKRYHMGCTTLQRVGDSIEVVLYFEVDILEMV